MMRNDASLDVRVAPRRRFAGWLGLFMPALLVAGSLAGTALAQQPTDAQRNAVRSACPADFLSQCPGVTPNGVEALTCLQQHTATLSLGCKQAVSAIGGASKATGAAPAVSPLTGAAAGTAATAAPAAPTPTPAQRNAIKSACRSDFMAQCSGVTPGGRAALSCLQQHSATLSTQCRQAVGAIGGTAVAPAPSPAPSTSPAAPSMAPATAAPKAMPAFSPRQEMFILREACGPDFRAFCRAVPLGGGRGIACLRENMPRLAPSCQRVLMHGM